MIDKRSDNFEVKTSRFEGVGITQVGIVSEFGSLTGMYSEASGKFGIGYVQVRPDAQGNGNGQELLKKSMEVASELGASVMHAAITTRTALEAFRKVFGDDAIDVEKEGQLTPKRNPAQI